MDFATFTSTLDWDLSKGVPDPKELFVAPSVVAPGFLIPECSNFEFNAKCIFNLVIYIFLIGSQIFLYYCVRNLKRQIAKLILSVVRLIFEETPPLRDLISSHPTILDDIESKVLNKLDSPKKSPINNHKSNNNNKPKVFDSFV